MGIGRCDKGKFHQIYHETTGIRYSFEHREIDTRDGGIRVRKNLCWTPETGCFLYPYFIESHNAISRLGHHVSSDMMQFEEELSIETMALPRTGGEQAGLCKNQPRCNKSAHQAEEILS